MDLNVQEKNSPPLASSLGHLALTLIAKGLIGIGSALCVVGVKIAPWIVLR